MEIKQYKLNSTKELDMDKEAERFLSKFNYIMYRENNYYDDSMTFMSIIFVNEAKIKIRTGESLKKIITDNMNEEIINVLAPLLRDEKYYETFNYFIYFIYSYVHSYYNIKYNVIKDTDTVEETEKSSTFIIRTRNSSGGTQAMNIIGPIIGNLILIAIIAFACIYCYKKKSIIF